MEPRLMWCDCGV